MGAYRWDRSQILIPPGSGPTALPVLPQLYLALGLALGPEHWPFPALLRGWVGPSSPAGSPGAAPDRTLQTHSGSRGILGRERTGSRPPPH